MKKKIYTKNDIDIERLSALARLSLTEAEKESFSCDLADAANYVTSLLCELEVSYEREALTLEELREDSSDLFDQRENMLSLSPDRKDDYLRVPRTVGKEKEEQ